MKTRLLKQLRSDAKDNVYLIPISGDKNRCVICIDNVEPSRYCSMCTITTHLYYFYYRIARKDISRSEIPSILRSDKSKKCIFQPYTFEEAIKKLEQRRRMYIISKIREMRLTWKKHQEKFMTSIWKSKFLLMVELDINDSNAFLNYFKC